METTESVAGLRCHECGGLFDIETAGRCPDCDGSFDVAYVDPSVDSGSFTGRVGTGLERYGPILPFPTDRLVRLGAGGTTLSDCPGLAEETGIERLAVKDESQHPTGSLADRGAALAVTAARERGATDVALPSTGDSAQAVAAAAARAEVASHAFVPSRTPFVTKAMINVHGGDMTVVGGRYADAAAAFEERVAAENWHRVDAFTSPYRHEGAATVAYELAEQLAWNAPDAVVVPTGQGTAPVGLALGFRRLREWGLIDQQPRLIVAQAAGCAPIVRAHEGGAETLEAVETPDTVVGHLEIPDPAGGDRVLDAIDASGGTAVAADDAALLQAAVDLAETGISAGLSAGAGLSAVRTLAAEGALGAGETVVLVNPTTGSREADVLRSQLMSEGR